MPATRFTQRGFPTQQQRDDFAAAWPAVFGQLAGRLDGTT
jgi:hypothetical protein